MVERKILRKVKMQRVTRMTNDTTVEKQRTIIAKKSEYAKYFGGKTTAEGR